jgi:hypothetical protein
MHTKEEVREHLSMQAGVVAPAALLANIHGVSTKHKGCSLVCEHHEMMRAVRQRMSSYRTTGFGLVASKHLLLVV